MAEFTVSNQNYKTRKMDAFVQLHVARRIAPLLGGLGDAYKRYIESGKDTLVIIDPVARSLAGLADADVEYVINACLAVCERRQGSGPGVTIWVNVLNNGSRMFQDIEMIEMIQICWAVIQEHLSPFLGALPADLVETLAKKAAPSTSH